MEILNCSKKKSIYNDLVTHYRINNTIWDDLAIHQQTILLNAYKRHAKINNTYLAIMDLRNILNNKINCMKGNDNPFCLRLAII